MVDEFDTTHACGNAMAGSGTSGVTEKLIKGWIGRRKKGKRVKDQQIAIVMMCTEIARTEEKKAKQSECDVAKDGREARKKY